jgi:hypothetical protein
MDFAPGKRPMKKRPGCEAAHTIVSPVSFKIAQRPSANRGMPVPREKETSNEPQARW